MNSDELRRTLLNHKRRTDRQLFDRAYAYIKQYYRRFLSATIKLNFDNYKPAPRAIIMSV